MEKILPPIPTDRVEKISAQLNFLWIFFNEFKNLWFFIATFAGILILSLPFILPGDSNSTAIVIQAIQLGIAVFVFSMLIFLQIKKKIKPKPAIDFKDYIRNLANFKGTKELGLKRIVNYYISLNGLNLEDESYISNLDTYIINNWLVDDSSNGMLLLGTTGSGKSTIFEFIAVTIARNWLKDSKNSRVPMIIDLRLLKDYGSLKNTIIATLGKLHITVESGNLWDKFSEMNRAGRILLLLDGFDETFDARVNYNSLHRHFNDITSLIETQSQMKIILSTRPEVFLSMKELQDIILLRKKSNIEESDDLERRLRIEKGEASFTAIKLQPVKSEQIRDYLVRRFGPQGNKKWQKIKDFRQLKDLARRPVTLDMVAMTVDKITESISLLALYDVYTNQWFKREIKKKALLQPELKRELVTEISWLWLQSSNRILRYSSMFEIKNKIEKRTNIDLSIICYIVEDLVKSSFFKHASTSREYTFQHKSFAEYFVAKSIAECVDNFQRMKLVEAFWKLDYVSQQAIISFSSKELYKAIIDDNIPLIEGKSEIKRIWLLTWVKLHEIDPLIRIRLPKQDIEEVIGGTSSYIIKYEEGILRKLDLSNLEINFLPNNILMMYPALQSLILSKNCLKVLPEAINRQDDLEILILKGNRFTNIPTNIVDLKNLRELNLEGNNIVEISKDFTFKLDSLNILSLANNGLKYVPNFISNLNNLQSLDLNGNEIVKLPEFLEKIKLKRLCLIDNLLHELPSFIKNMEDLVSLEFSSLFLKEIPSFIGKMKLRRLKIKDILSPIPEFIGDMKGLQVLELIGFQPKRLLEYIRSTQSSDLELEETNLKSPKILQFIKNKGEMQKFLASNKLKEIPLFLKSLNELKRLYLEGFSLTNNMIQEFLKDIDLLGISLRNNDLKEIPTICSDNLNRIDLSENKIYSISDICHFKDLRVINLGSNLIKSIPKEILQVKNLRYLDLSNNDLQEIPFWIYKLEELRVLILTDNKIRKIPETILNMSKLRILNLDLENLEENSRFIAKDFKTLKSV